MLALRDPGTGSLVPVRAAGMLRMCVRGPARGHQAGPDELRRLLTADLVRRVPEDLDSTQVLLVMVRAELRPHDGTSSGDRTPEGSARVLNQELDALWVRPFSGVADTVARAEEWLGGRVHLLVEGDRRLVRAPEGRRDTMRLRVGATGGGHVLPRPWRDPLAARLALLELPYAQPSSLTCEQLDEAAATLVRWRSLVGYWADQPAAPMRREVVDRVCAALDADLDVRAALGVLRALEVDPAVPPGAKLDTFLYLDRTFGFDLVRHLAGGSG